MFKRGRKVLEVLKCGDDWIKELVVSIKLFRIER